MTTTPPMQRSNEATPDQLTLAREQGDAMGKALAEMVQDEAHGRQKKAGDYVIAIAAEEAEGMYWLSDGELEWQEPNDENVHIEVVVLDGGDGRFIPGLQVEATIFAEEGTRIGSHTQPFLWHPWLYHYGRNWQLPADGNYDIRVHIDAPRFGRHDPRNGLRYAGPVDVEFKGFPMTLGQKRSESAKVS